MLYSMTGFGKGTAELSGKKITVEVKSLNSKQADIAVRIPTSLRAAELELCNRVAGALIRGKIDVTVTVESVGCDTAMRLNLPALEEYKRQVLEMQERLGLPEPSDWYTLLMRFPDAMKTEAPADADDSETSGLFAALDEALAAIKTYRRTEGAKLETFFAERVARIGKYLAGVPEFEGERIVRIRTRIQEGLAGLSNVDYDRSRLEQELFFYIEKLDITEEKQRLAQHLEYFLQTMNGDGDALGKKLGFISQEMGREINTLGSKSNDADMQRLVVMMKDELEQIKEQVLNAL